MTTTEPRIILKTSGLDGNYFGLLGAALKAAKQAGWSGVQLDDFKREALKGGFDNLLRVMQFHFDVD